MITVSIDSIAAGGDGVGRHPDGRVVFVPRTSPGDIAEVREVEQRQRYVRASLVKVTEPGVGRTKPACPHYTRDGCGGCQLQHLTSEAQRDAKRRIVGDALRRIGKVDVEDPSIVPSPLEWRYRSKISMAVVAGSEPEQLTIGLHRHTRPQQVFPLDDCLIVREPVMELWNAVRPHTHLLPRSLQSLVLRQDREGFLHVVAIGSKPVAADRRDTRPWDAAPLAQAVGDATVSYWWAPWRGAGRIVAGPRNGFPALAFEQTNQDLAARIRREAVESLGDVGQKVVWDLYGGVGDTASLLLARGAKVWTVDSDRAAKDWADRHNGPDVRRLVDSVENALHRLPAPGAVVANPPRAGLGAPVAAWLNRWGSATPGVRLAYVSCDAATLARDMARMPSLILRSVTAFDLFPQTSHVETLVVLESAS